MGDEVRRKEDFGEADERVEVIFHFACEKETFYLTSLLTSSTKTPPSFASFFLVIILSNPSTLFDFSLPTPVLAMVYKLITTNYHFPQIVGSILMSISS